MSNLMEAIKKMQQGEIAEAVKFNGRTFKNTKSFKDDDSTNSFLQKNKDWGVVGEKGGMVYVAPMKDMGEGFEPELAEAKKENEDKDLDRVDRDEAKKDFEDREDKDLDNDGDSDDSDKYLHKRRKAISKALTKEEVEDLDEAARRKRAPKFKDDSVSTQREKDKLPLGSKYKKTSNRAGSSTRRSLSDIRKRSEKTAAKY